VVLFNTHENHLLLSEAFFASGSFERWYDIFSIRMLSGEVFGILTHSKKETKSNHPKII
jgi:hypothetical protein